MGLVDRTRGLIYDKAIVGLTAGWYAAVLERLPVGCHLLDVGIGTGSALLANAALVVAKNIRVTGVDIDAAYVERCNRAIAQTGIGPRIVACHESIYDHRGGPYGAVYFSASFMLLPDPPAALRHVQSLLAPGGRIFFTQTFEHERSRAVEALKPLLRHVTTIDFGRVTYEADFRRALEAGGVSVVEFARLNGGRKRSGALAVGVARGAGA